MGFNGSIKLSDFGIASIKSQSLTGVSRVIGSPSYIAPEIIVDNKYSEVSDLFAVGVLLYRCLIGYCPFRGPSIKEILKATRRVTPTAPHAIDPKIPESLSNIVMSLLIKDPTKRPNDAAMVADTLEREFGVQKWAPQFLHDTPVTQESGAKATAIMPDALTEKLLRANNE